MSFQSTAGGESGGQDKGERIFFNTRRKLKTNSENAYFTTGSPLAVQSVMPPVML